MTVMDKMRGQEGKFITSTIKVTSLTSLRSTITATNQRINSPLLRPPLHNPLRSTLLHLSNSTNQLPQFQRLPHCNQSPRPRRPPLLLSINPHHNPHPLHFRPCNSRTNPPSFRNISHQPSRHPPHPLITSNPLRRPYIRTPSNRLLPQNHHLASSNFNILDLPNQP